MLDCSTAHRPRRDASSAWDHALAKRLDLTHTHLSERGHVGLALVLLGSFAVLRSEGEDLALCLGLPVLALRPGIHTRGLELGRSAERLAVTRLNSCLSCGGRSIADLRAGAVSR